MWIDEIVCLRSKKYSFGCGNDSKNILKADSKPQSKHFEYKCYKKTV